ncbi:MAG: hypothetical protein ABFD24_07525 [Anaerolineaceae bacterium]
MTVTIVCFSQGACFAYLTTLSNANGACHGCTLALVAVPRVQAGIDLFEVNPFYDRDKNDPHLHCTKRSAVQVSACASE